MINTLLYIKNRNILDVFIKIFIKSIDTIKISSHIKDKLCMYSKLSIKAFITLTTAILFFSSCIEPSPLYGTWADNKGNTFSFFDDNTFSARVARAGRPSEFYEGNYTLLLNVITLNCSNVDLRIVTEWDLRGNILYLNWTSADGESMALSLYKISN